MPVTDAPGVPLAGPRPSRAPLGVLLGATLVSVAGDGITEVGVPWLALLTTGSAGKADPSPTGRAPGR